MAINGHEALLAGARWFGAHPELRRNVLGQSGQKIGFTLVKEGFA